MQLLEQEQDESPYGPICAMARLPPAPLLPRHSWSSNSLGVLAHRPWLSTPVFAALCLTTTAIPRRHMRDGRTDVASGTSAVSDTRAQAGGSNRAADPGGPCAVASARRGGRESCERLNLNRNLNLCRLSPRHARGAHAGTVQEPLHCRCYSGALTPAKPSHARCFSADVIILAMSLGKPHWRYSSGLPFDL